MRDLRRIGLCIATGLNFFLLASTSQAAITFSRTLVDNSTGGAALNGYVTNDIRITFDGQYTGAQALIELTGSGPLVYQDAVGSASPPHSAFVALFPSLAFDTFAAQGSAFSGGANGEPALGGGAVDLGGAAAATFNSTPINQAWNPAGGVTITDQTNFLIGRFTLSKTASGTAKFLASAGGKPVEIFATVGKGVIGAEPDLIPTVADFADSAALNEVIATTLTATGDAPITWGNLADFTYTQGFGAKPNPTGIHLQPTWNPATQAFNWDTAGSTRGTYTWNVSATSVGGTDTGLISIDVPFVPEPGTLALFGLAFAGVIGCSRRRS